MKENEKKGTPTPEEQSLPAATDTRQKLLRVFFRELTKTSLYALAAIGVLVLASIAWFVSNNSVNSGTSPVQAGHDTIRLATKRTDYRQQAEMVYLNLDDGTPFPSEDDPEYYFTAGGTIALRLSDQSTFVAPGSSGMIQFYIIPNRDGKADIPLYLGLAGFQERKEGGHTSAHVQNDAVLNALLSGHILLFEHCKNGKYSGWIPPTDSEPGELGYRFSVRLPDDARTDVPHLVQFYWTWPLLYENMTELDGVSDFIDFIQSQAEHTTQIEGSRYHYSRIFLTKATENLTSTNPDMQLAARTEGYNQADEYIGANADYLYLTIQTNSTFDFPESRS